MRRAIRWYDAITINIYYVALTMRAQTLTPIVVPLLVQQFVGDARKGSYFGIIRLWALMVAILTQSLVGLASDRSTLPWGRRRPFIVVGTLVGLIVLALIGFAADLEGMTGYWALFLLYGLSMLASDTAHAATQGLIPDLVPEEKRGLFSGVKAILEVPIPLVFVSLVVGPLIARGNLWGGLVAVMAVLTICMLAALWVPEQRQEKAPFGLEQGVVGRLFLMTGAFALVIMGTGAAVGAVQRLTAARTANPLPWVTGLLGVAGMASAVVIGVWVSIWIGIGCHARRNASFAWWVANRLAFLVAANGASGFMLYYLQERFAGLQGEEAAAPASLVMMSVGIAILVAAVPSGWLADRVGKRLLVAISGLVATAGMLVVLLVPGMAALYVGGVLIGAAIGLFYSANWALGTKVVPEGQAGRYFGIANLSGAGAGAIGAYIGGPIADNGSYVLLFAIYGTLFLLSILALRGIREV